MAEKKSNKPQGFVRREVEAKDLADKMVYFINHNASKIGLMWCKDNQTANVIMYLNGGSQRNVSIPEDIRLYTCSKFEKDMLVNTYHKLERYDKYNRILTNEEVQTDKEHKYFKYRNRVKKIYDWLLKRCDSSAKKIVEYNKLGRKRHFIHYYIMRPKVLVLNIPQPYFKYHYHKYRYLYTKKWLNRIEKYNDKRTIVPITYNY